VEEVEVMLMLAARHPCGWPLIRGTPRPALLATHASALRRAMRDIERKAWPALNRLPYKPCTNVHFIVVLRPTTIRARAGSPSRPRRVPQTASCRPCFGSPSSTLRAPPTKVPSP
jgi:hypothetical protein